MGELMKDELNKALENLTSTYLSVNYNLTWLKAMLLKGKRIKEHGTLVTGSSHALYGVHEAYLSNSVNCSMHSQDIYYNFLCAKEVLENGIKGAYDRAFIVMGYYIAFQDLSKSTIMREKVIAPVYYPIFRDAHNWEMPNAVSPWSKIGELPEEAKRICEILAEQTLLQKESYFSDLKPRKPFFDFEGRSWHTLSLEEKDEWGEKRAECHNKLAVYKDSFVENCEIMKDLVGLLKLHGITPVVVIPPFTSAYNKYVESRYKEAIVEMLEKIDQEVHFVDFNDSDFFEDRDFVDTDHLNKVGANKLSSMLYQIFI